MSGDNRTSGPTNIYNLSPEVYQQYAQREKELEQTQLSDQVSAMARGAAQLLQTTVTPSELNRMWGLDEKAPIVRTESPPGYDLQMAPVGGSGEYIFGAASHLSSQEATVRTIAAPPAEIDSMVSLVQMARADLMDKNGVMARTASLRQG